MRRAAALLASLALLITLVPSAALAAPSEDPATWIVTLRGGVDPSSAAPDLARRHGGRIGFVYEHAINGFSFRGSQAAASALGRNPNVLTVEPNAEVWLDATQSPATWGLDRIDQPSLPLSNSYTYTSTGAGVTAYVIDSGIRFSHNEFGGRAVRGADFVGDGQNGGDCNGHGTHVAGTIGGSTYGVAKDVTLVSVRVFGCSGGSSWETIIAGIDWVIGHHTGGPAVANMSLGGGANSSVDAATNNLINDGVATAVAAGNGNFIGRQANACNYSPARVPNAMTISATNSSDQKASWANYGDCVDWFAPGVSITSAWYSSNSATNTISGTSMATPHTAGVAALYLEAHPSHSPLQVRDAIYAATTKDIVTSSSTANNHLLYSLVTDGGGGGDTTPPSAPTGLTASAGDASVALDWADNSESDLAGYNVYRSTTSGGPYAKVNGDLQGASAFTDTGLTNGTTYYYVVNAVDTSGNPSANSNQQSATPLASGGGTEAEFSLALGGTSSSQGSSWTAMVTVTATNSNGSAVSGVTVTGSWSSGSSDTSCVTGPSGTCTVTSSQHKRVASVSFSVTSAAHSTLTYDGGPDSVTVAKP